MKTICSKLFGKLCNLKSWHSRHVSKRIQADRYYRRKARKTKTLTRAHPHGTTVVAEVHEPEIILFMTLPLMSGHTVNGVVNGSGSSNAIHLPRFAGEGCLFDTQTMSAIERTRSTRRAFKMLIVIIQLFWVLDIRSITHTSMSVALA